MRCKNFLTGVFHFPFRRKTWVFLLIFCFPAAIFASGNVSSSPQSNSSEARQLIKQAEKLTQRGELTEAEKILRRVVEQNQANSNAKLKLANVLFKQRRFIPAYEISIEIAKAEPKNSFAFALAGSILLNAGNFSDSRTFFHTALSLSNREALAWAGLGMLNFYENRVHLGIENLLEAVYLQPNEPDFVFALAQVSARAEKYKEAAAAYKRFLEISPATDHERRARIKGLIDFLNFLGNRQTLYSSNEGEKTIVPFRLVNERPVVQIKLHKNGEPLNFVLDTGAGISVISAETAARLNIKPIARGGLARGVGGDGKFEIVYGFLNSVFIGDIRVKNVPVYIRTFHNSNEKIDGYIGLALISKFLTTIDYGDLTFELVNKKSAPKNYDNEMSLPLRLTNSGFLSGEVGLEGIDVPLNFIVDTGASISVISEALAASKELSGFAKNERMRVVGAAGITENVPLFLLPQVSFGNHSRRSISAIALDLEVINETAGFEQSGILGGNFLKNFRLTFDFQNSKVIFVPLVK